MPISGESARVWVIRSVFVIVVTVEELLVTRQSTRDLIFTACIVDTSSDEPQVNFISWYFFSSSLFYIEIMPIYCVWQPDKKKNTKKMYKVSHEIRFQMYVVSQIVTVDALFKVNIFLEE